MWAVIVGLVYAAVEMHVIFTIGILAKSSQFKNSWVSDFEMIFLMHSKF